MIPTEMEVDRDGITATLKDGFLTIALPQRQPVAVESRSIPIEVVSGE